MAKRQSNLKQFAVIGARMRIQELQAEIARITKQFGARVLGVALRPSTTSEPTAAPKRRRRRKMSADARRRISEAQKARWAKQRARAAQAGGKKR